MTVGKCLTVVLSIGSALVAGAAQARDLTVVSFGGALQDAARTAFITPFASASGQPVKEDVYDGALAKISAQVKANAVNWDVVDAESNVVQQGCDEGYFEPLDWSLFDKSAFIPAATQKSKCGIGFLTGAVVLTYDEKKLAEGPKTWADFWDTTKFPGRRGLRFNPKWTLELALLADGVPPAQVYAVLKAPGGVDRAFKKLDQIKPQIAWWKLGAEAIQLLGSGEVTMAAAYNGRVAAAVAEEGKSYRMVWDAGSLYFLDYWVVVKGTPNRDAAMKFIAFASKPENQVEFSKKVAYGPTALKAYDIMDPKVKASVPTPERLATAVLRDDDFWLDQGDTLTERFNVWAAQK